MVGFESYHRPGTEEEKEVQAVKSVGKQREERRQKYAKREIDRDDPFLDVKFEEKREKKKQESSVIREMKQIEEQEQLEEEKEEEPIEEQKSEEEVEEEED